MEQLLSGAGRQDISEIELSLSRAKVSLILTQPFYAALSCSMRWERDDSVPTMATDGETIYWNASFMDRMTPSERVFVVCHELLHCVFQHMGRLAGRDAYNWNFATDCAINNMLIKDRVGTMPKGGIDMPGLAAAGNYLAEDIYALLPPPPPEDEEGGPGTGKIGPLDRLLKPKGSPAEQAAHAANMKAVVAQAAQAAKMQGTLSAGLARVVGDLLYPKVPWQDALRRFINTRSRIDYSYARPKRRFLGEDFYLPSLGGLSMGDIVVAIDCSGSIGPKELDAFAAEIYAIKQEARPKTIHVLYFDSSISHYDCVDRDDDLKISAHGGGGTAFSPIFKYVDQNNIAPAACIVLTDMCCDDFGPPPDYPVLWVSNYARGSKAPFGEVLMM